MFVPDARNLAIYLARRLSGPTLAAIREVFGLEHYNTVSSVASRMKQRLVNDRSLRR
jgi:chromosomal replication initiation ATPase DnaA